MGEFPVSDESSDVDWEGPVDPWVANATGQEEWERIDNLFSVAEASIGTDETEPPTWLADLRCFRGTHDEAAERFLAAVGNPTKDNIDLANEAALAAKKMAICCLIKVFTGTSELKI